MAIQFLSPKGMPQPVPYHHVAVGSGARQVHVAGQISRDAVGTPLAPEDLAEQVAHALRNTAAGLAAAGASFRDVVRLTFSVTAWQPEKIDASMEGIGRVADELDLPQPMPPASLIGVAHLFMPDVLVEVEATAVLD